MAGGRNDVTRGATVLVEGFFASAWFGWGSSTTPGHGLPGWLSVLLTIGSVAGIVLAIIGVVIVVRAARSGQRSALADPAARRRYLIAFWSEVVVAVAGGVLLGAFGQPEWVAVLVAAAVGIHFIPLAGVFDDPQLIPIGVLIVIVAVVALVLGLTTDVLPVHIAGPGTGLCLLAGSLLALISPADDFAGPEGFPGTVGGPG